MVYGDFSGYFVARVIECWPYIAKVMGLNLGIVTVSCGDNIFPPRG